MKSYLIKMLIVLLLVICFSIAFRKEENNTLITDDELKEVVNNEEVDVEPVVYEDLTLQELGKKIDNVFNSTLDGYGEIVASKSLESNIDPVVAASIILVETGCKWTCSSLVRNNNNVGGMRGSKGYMTFNTLEDGIQAFINNLSRNYYEKGLNTPELMNKKYAENPNWHKDVYYYVDLIKAS